MASSVDDALLNSDCMVDALMREIRMEPKLIEVSDSDDSDSIDNEKNTVTLALACRTASHLHFKDKKREAENQLLI